MHKLFAKSEALALLGFAVAALAACTPPPVVYAPVEVTSFTATPETIGAGGETTLAWTVKGDVASIELFKGADSLGSQEKATGTLAVTGLAAGRNTFSLLVIGKGGDEVRADAAVTGVTAATIGRFAADKTAIAAGTAVTLSWETALADTVTITAANATVGQKTGADAAAGALLVKPTATTEYTLKAEGIGGSDTKKVLVQVLPAPVFAKLDATPATVKAGEAVTISWTTSGATGLRFLVAGRTVYTAEAEKVADGSRSFTMDQATILTAIASGPGGETAQDLTVNVIQNARVVSFFAEPPDTVLGNAITLRWELVGVDGVALEANGAAVDLAGAAGPAGSIELTPTETTLYRISGAGEGGETSAEITVNVYGVPTIDTFESDRTVVFRRREPATLTWATRNGTVISIADSDGNLVDLGTQPVDAGSVQVSPLDTSDFTLTLVGPGGVVQSQPVHIAVSEPPPAVTLSLAKTTILEGESTVLSWHVEDFDTVAIEANGTPIDLAGKNLAEDVLSVNPIDTTAYTLKAHSNTGGDTQKTVTLTVVKQPKFLEFTSDRVDANGQVTVTKGREFDVSWRTSDATSVEFNPPRLEYDAPTYVSIEGLPGTQNVVMTHSSPSSINDDGTAEIAFPDGFEFPFLGGKFASVQMAVDGYLCFGGTAQCNAASSSNQNIPSTSKPNNLIAPFWDDLELQSYTKVLWRMDGTAPNRTATFEWKNHDSYWSWEDGAMLTFKVVLFENGDWEMWNAPRPVPTKNQGENTRWGTTATIGIEGPGGSQAVVASYLDTSALCSEYTPGSGSTFGKCTPITRIRPQKLAPSGSRTMTVSTSTILKMKAYGPVGTTDSPDLVVTAVDAAVVNAFSASRTHVGAGESVDFSYSIGPSKTVVKRVTIKSDSGELLLDTPDPLVLSGSIPGTPTRDSTYTIEVVNAAGDKDSKSVTVKVDAPIATFVADKTSGAVGDKFKFTWTSEGASTLVVKKPDGTALVGPYTYPADKSAMASGSRPDVVVTESGRYTLEATNGTGTTTLGVDITIVTDLQVLSFTATPTEQTEGKNTLLEWEIYNGSELSIAIAGEEGLLTTPPITDPSGIRKSSFLAPVRATDTTYVLTAKKADGTQLQRSVTVTSVKAATVQFAATPASVGWNQETTLAWSTTNATKVNIYELVGTGASATVGAELTAARDVLSGSLRLRLLKTTGFRIVAKNRLGSEESKDIEQVQVMLEEPTMALNVSPDAAPRGGFFNVSWEATQGEKVYLWQRDPANANGGGTTSPVDVVQMPYDYVPFNFVDISRTGTDLTAQVYAPSSSGTKTPNIDNGLVMVDFPADFRPHFLGEDAGRMLVTTEGALFLLPPAAADSEFDTYCRTSTCNSTSPSDIVHSTSTTARTAIYPFHSALSARQGCSSTVAACSTGRTPGKLLWEVRGTKPNRMLIVQWDNWDTSSSSYVGTLTFQAQLHENGDVEFQYKTLASKDAKMNAGGYAIIGVDKRKWAGNSMNYFLALGNKKQFLTPGDGYRIYSGTQAPSGTIRTFFNTQTSPPTGQIPQVVFRGTATNARATLNRKVDTRKLDVLAGVDDILISEIMIDPLNGEDTNREWIELRNTRTVDAPLRGYTLQTSNGSYTFTGGTIPAKSGSLDGYLIIGQSAVDGDNGGVPVSVAYGNGVKMHDITDSVVLRYNNILIDRVEYDGTAGWRVPRGKTLSADPSIGATAFGNDSAEAWCSGRNPLDLSAVSTPGGVNPPCAYFEVTAADASYDLRSDTSLTNLVSGTGDDRSGTVSLAFPFKWFGSSYSSATVTDNGFITFGGIQGSSYSNAALPTSTNGGNDGIYAYWDDLYPRTGGGSIVTKTFGEAPNRYQVIQWVGYRTSSTSTELDFLIVLREDGTWEIQYLALTGLTGSSATIGIEWGNDTMATQFSSNTASLPPSGASVPFGLRYTRAP